jgi:hypothetical protein
VEEVLPPWASLATWVGLVVTVLVSVFKRWLVPKSHHAEVVRQLEARLDDRDELIRELRAANIALDARNDMLSDQVRQLVGMGHSTAAAITAQVIEADDAAPGGFGARDSGGQNPTPNGRAETGVNRTTPRRRGGRR